jgi:hypothetical protein
MRTGLAVVAAVEVDPGEVATVAARGGLADVWRRPEAAKQKKKKQQEKPVPSKAARLAAGLCLRHWQYRAQAFSCGDDCCWLGNGQARGN